MALHGLALEDHFLTRRQLLRRSGMGFGMLGLASVLGSASLTSTAQASTDINPLAPRKPHFPPKARQVVHLFMNGGPSHVDTFDPKPLLDKFHGKPLPSTNLRTERRTGAAFRSPFRFQKYGKSGIEVSEIFANVATCIDDIAVIRSMHADVPTPDPPLMVMNCRG